MTLQTEITEPGLADLVRRFYTKVRQDPEIGPVFNSQVEHWDEHFATLSKFWSSVMLTSGAYKGNPMGVHTKIADLIKLPMFDRWLGLWKETTEEVFAPEHAAALQDRAQRIAKSLKYGLEFETNRNEAARESR
jgi:hemoglobin